MITKLVFALLVFIPLSNLAQVVTPTEVPLTRSDYLHKATVNKTTAWVLLSAGVTGLIATALVDAGETGTRTLTTVLSFGFVEPEPKKSYTAPYVISVIVAGASIPFFSAAVKNRRLAKSVSASFIFEKIDVPHYAVTERVYYPAGTIKISF